MKPNIPIYYIIVTLYLMVYCKYKAKLLCNDNTAYHNFPGFNTSMLISTYTNTLLTFKEDFMHYVIIIDKYLITSVNIIVFIKYI